jgi:hypothetical protein
MAQTSYFPIPPATLSKRLPALHREKKEQEKGKKDVHSGLVIWGGGTGANRNEGVMSLGFFHYIYFTRRLNTHTDLAV